MRGTDHRLPLLTAIFMALLLAAFPASVQAASATGFDTQTCMQNQANNYTNHAQIQTTAIVKVFSNASNPDMKLVYCWDQVKAMFNTIGTLTSGNSIFGSIIWQVIQAAISSFLNQICQAVMSAISSAINMIKSMLCIPLPHFSLGGLGGGGFSLGSFGGGTCNGISLLGSTSGSGTRPASPNGYSPLWNYSP